MTCDEFRAIASTKDPTETTRGERAAMCKHYARCDGCRVFIPPDTGPMSSELESICVGDRRDPEFREAAYGRRTT